MKLAKAIALTGARFPNPQGLLRHTTPFSQAGILVSFLVQNLPRGAERLALARSLMLEAQSIQFAAECFLWLRSGEEKPEKDRILSREDEEEMGKALAGRINELAQRGPIWLEFSERAPLLIDIWSHWTPKEEVRKHLQSAFRDPKNAVEVLKTYLPTSWELETGRRSKGDFGKDNFESAKEYLDAELIYEALRRIYGNALEDPAFQTDEERSLDEKTAHQFAWHYHREKGKEEGRSPGG